MVCKSSSIAGVLFDLPHTTEEATVPQVLSDVRGPQHLGMQWHRLPPTSSGVAPATFFSYLFLSATRLLVISHTHLHTVNRIVLEGRNGDMFVCLISYFSLSLSGFSILCCSLIDLVRGNHSFMRLALQTSQQLMERHMDETQRIPFDENLYAAQCTVVPSGASAPPPMRSLTGGAEVHDGPAQLPEVEPYPILKRIDFGLAACDGIIREKEAEALNTQTIARISPIISPNSPTLLRPSVSVTSNFPHPVPLSSLHANAAASHDPSTSGTDRESKELMADSDDDENPPGKRPRRTSIVVLGESENTNAPSCTPRWTVESHLKVQSCHGTATAIFPSTTLSEAVVLGDEANGHPSPLIIGRPAGASFASRGAAGNVGEASWHSSGVTECCTVMAQTLNVCDLPLRHDASDPGRDDGAESRSTASSPDVDLGIDITNDWLAKATSETTEDDIVDASGHVTSTFLMAKMEEDRCLPGISTAAADSGKMQESPEITDVCRTGDDAPLLPAVEQLCHQPVQKEGQTATSKSAGSPHSIARSDSRRKAKRKRRSTPPRPSASAPPFQAGVRVLARWGRCWYPATTMEAERNGYVQIKWDNDGGCLHLKVKELRIHPSVSALEGCQEPRGSCAAGGNIVLTGTQLVALMNVEDELENTRLSPKEEGSRLRNTGVSNLQPINAPPDTVVVDTKPKGDVSPGSTQPAATSAQLLPAAGDVRNMIVYVSAALQVSEEAHQASLLYLQECGATVIEGDVIALITVLYGKGRETVPQRCFLIFLIPERARCSPTSSMGGAIALASYAHALGVTPLRLDWLGAVTPGTQPPWGRSDFTDYTSSPHDTLHLTPFASKERFLSNKRIVSLLRHTIAADDPVRQLVEMAGGSLVPQAAFAETAHPDFLYVPAGHTARLNSRGASWISSVPHLAADELCVALHRHIETTHRSLSDGSLQSSPTASQKPPVTEFGPQTLQFTPPPHSVQELRCDTGTNALCIPTQMIGGDTGSPSPLLVAPRRGAFPIAQRSLRRRVQSFSVKDNSCSEERGDGLPQYPPVSEGEDYYFRLPHSDPDEVVDGAPVAPQIAIGRVVTVCNNTTEDAVVTLQQYKMRRVTMLQNPYTGELERQSTVTLGTSRCTVPVSALLFGTPLYVVSAAALRHVYVLFPDIASSPSGGHPSEEGSRYVCE